MKRRIAIASVTLITAVLIVTQIFPVQSLSAAAASKLWDPERTAAAPAGGLSGVFGSITDSSNNVLTIYQAAYGSPAGEYICVVKYDPSGTELGKNCFRVLETINSEFRILNWISDGKDGGIVSLRRSGFGPGVGNIMRINGSLNVVWAKSGSSTDYENLVSNTVITSDGNVVIIGTADYFGNKNLYGAKLNINNGSLIWDRGWQSAFRDDPICGRCLGKITAGLSGDVFISATNYANLQLFIHLDSSGARIGYSQYADPDPNVSAMVADIDGLPIIAKSWTNPITLQKRISLQKFDVNGNKKWTDSGVIITQSGNNSDYSFNPRLVKTPKTGGVYVAWVENPNKLKVQHVGSDGEAWTDSVELTSTAVSALSLFPFYALQLDPNNDDATVAWLDNRSGPGCTTIGACVYAQRVGSSGKTEWNAGGFFVNNNAVIAAGIGNGLGSVSDGGTGLYISWFSNGDNVRSQRVTGPDVPEPTYGNYTVYGGVVQITNGTDTMELGNAAADIASTGNIYLLPGGTTAPNTYFTKDTGAAGTQRLVINAGRSNLHALTARADNAKSAIYAEQTGGGYAAVFNGAVHINGLLLAGSGANKAAKLTTSRGATYFYAIESPDVAFEDFGRGKITNGRAEIKLDRVFLETVEGDYSVELTAEGQPADLAVIETRPDSFLVAGPDGAGFSYRLSATRRGYQGLRFTLKDVQP